MWRRWWQSSHDAWRVCSNGAVLAGDAESGEAADMWSTEAPVLAAAVAASVEGRGFDKRVQPWELTERFGV
jgi:hypothetical protein